MFEDSLELCLVRDNFVLIKLNTGLETFKSVHIRVFIYAGSGGLAPLRYRWRWTSVRSHH